MKENPESKAFYERLKQQLKDDTSWPSPYMFKFIVPASLEAKGFACLHEISRQIILEAQQQGIDQLFLEDPLLFSRKLMEGRLAQFKEAASRKEEILFYDRGLPDVTAYLDYLGTSYPDEFRESCSSYVYDAVFVLPPWPDIYIQDNERYESYAEAEKIFQHLVNGYSNNSIWTKKSNR